VGSLVVMGVLLKSPAAAACALAALLTAAPAWAAPPPSDDGGYLDSTARCDAPATLVAFGRTESSRVAICKDADGYSYRGVRVRDGAKLVIPASASGKGWVAKQDGFTYTVTSTSLEVAAGSQVMRDEPMVGFYQPGVTPDAPSAPATPTTTVPLGPPLPAEVGGSSAG
jgi:hypothetical protein